jgi:hypothetical protein
MRLSGELAIGLTEMAAEGVRELPPSVGGRCYPT